MKTRIENLFLPPCIMCDYRKAADIWVKDRAKLSKGFRSYFGTKEWSRWLDTAWPINNYKTLYHICHRCYAEYSLHNLTEVSLAKGVQTYFRYGKKPNKKPRRVKPCSNNTSLGLTL